MSSIAKFLPVAMLAALAGCATLTEDSIEQLVEVHAVHDSREVAGVGCVLSNQNGRWFVTAPGRVTIARSALPLTVDCARNGMGRAISHVQPRYDAHALIGNVVATAGIGYIMDTYSGNGFFYPPVITVVIPKAPAGDVKVSGSPNNQVF